ncbi:MAG: hypothetical protein ACT4OT_11160 [Acidobacteriota bacterium]
MFVVLVIVPTILVRATGKAPNVPTPFVFMFFSFVAAPIYWGLARALIEYTKPVDVRMAEMGLFVQVVIWVMGLFGIVPGVGGVSLLAAFSVLMVFIVDIFVGVLYFFGLIKRDSLIDSGYRMVRGA